MGNLDEFPLTVRLFLRAYKWRRIDPVPWTSLSKPLSQSRVALVTSAGFVLPEQDPFDPSIRGGDPSFREIPNDVDSQSLSESHRSKSFDHSGIRRDPNIAFPIDRLRELDQKLESALNKAGFEVIGRENLERLARENLGVQTAPLNLLYIKYSLLLLQTLLMGGEPKLFLPFLAILRPSGDFTDICLMSVATREKTPQPGLGEQLMHQAWEKLSRATETLSAVS